MAKITIDWGDNVKIKEEYEVPYCVARAVDVLIEKYKKRHIKQSRIVVEVREEWQD
jgi:uncharacterized protein YajQ (UPF0234 family)